MLMPIGNCLYRFRELLPAKAALTEAKATGKNRVCHDPTIARNDA
jgi:hypothetical protein